MKKRFSLLSGLLLCLLFTASPASGQDESSYVIHKHEFIPFSEFGGDTIAFIKRNFDGGNNKYIWKPTSILLADINTAASIRSFYPYYSPQLPEEITAVICFIYSKEELKQRITSGKAIGPITISFLQRVNNERHPDVYKALHSMGKEQVFDWTPAIEKMLGDIQMRNVFRDGRLQETAQYLGINP